MKVLLKILQSPLVGVHNNLGLVKLQHEVSKTGIKVNLKRYAFVSQVRKQPADFSQIILIMLYC